MHDGVGDENHVHDGRADDLVPHHHQDHPMMNNDDDAHHHEEGADAGADFLDHEPTKQEIWEVRFRPTARQKQSSRIPKLFVNDEIPSKLVVKRNLYIGKCLMCIP